MSTPEPAPDLLLVCARQCLRVGLLPLGTAWLFTLHVRADDWLITMQCAGAGA